MKRDVPAAHSMDTTWYAVDEEGVVAEFDTGEAGALPEPGALYHPDSKHSFDAFPLAAARMARLAARGALDTELDPEPDSDERVIVVEAAPEVVADGVEGYRAGETTSARIARELAPYDPWVVREAEPRVLATQRPLPLAECKRIRTLRGVAHLIAEYSRVPAFEEQDERDGMFRFENEDYDVPGAYVRRSAPEEPIRVEELPEATRKQVRTLSLPLRFGEASSLQLADYFGLEELPSWNDEIDARGQPREQGAGAADPARTRAVVMLLLVAAALVIMWMLSRSG